MSKAKTSWRVRVTNEDIDKWQALMSGRGYSEADIRRNILQTAIVRATGCISGGWAVGASEGEFYFMDSGGNSHKCITPESVRNFLHGTLFPFPFEFTLSERKVVAR